jgi:hypothetical protein
MTAPALPRYSFVEARCPRCLTEPCVCRIERCACGGWVATATGHVEEAVKAHNASALHQAWRKRRCACRGDA